MAVASAPESFHSVTLSVDGTTYTSNLWRGSGAQWRLLSVEVHGLPLVSGSKIDYPSCRASLEAAEAIAKDVMEQAPRARRHRM